MIRPVKTIEIQDWMSAAPTQAVLSALDPAGQGMQALLVGGCVRNTLLGKPVDDIDMATILTPEEVTKRLNAAGIKVIPTGIDHGTVTAVSDGRAFEITTLRKDVETFGRHAVVAYTDDWREDAQRRDFTMNTLLADAAGHIYDPTGQGLDDLRARRVVFVGNPETRIAEDYLRILRFFRFHAYYGQGTPDENALAACRSAAPHIADLSRERVTQEVFKILSVDNPLDILGVMFENNILNKISNAQDKIEALGALSLFQKKYSSFRISTRLFIFQSVDKAGMEGLSPFLILSNADKKELEILLEVLFFLKSDARDPASLKQALYHYGREMSVQGLLLHAAYAGDEKGLDKAVAFLKSCDNPVFPLRGADIMAAGVPHGPQIGEILSAVEQWWINQDFAPDKAACLEQVKGLI